MIPYHGFVSRAAFLEDGRECPKFPPAQVPKFEEERP